MSIYYRMDELAENFPGSKKGLYPRIITKRTIFLEELTEKASHNTTLTHSEVKMATELVIKQIIAELKDGNMVCLDDIGSFSLSAASKTVQDEHALRSDSISVKRLTFRMSRAFLHKLGMVKFERVPVRFIKRLPKGK